MGVLPGPPLQVRILLSLALGACFVLAGGGCVSTTASEKSGLGGARFGPPDTVSAAPRDQQRSQALSLLRPRAGVTTADDFRRVVGTPDYATDDGLFAAYLLEQFRASGGLEVYDGSKPKGPTYRDVVRTLLVVQFSKDGVLARRKSVRIPSEVVPSERFFEIARRWELQQQAGGGEARAEMGRP